MRNASNARANANEKPPFAPNIALCPRCCLLRALVRSAGHAPRSQAHLSLPHFVHKAALGAAGIVGLRRRGPRPPRSPPASLPFGRHISGAREQVRQTATGLRRRARSPCPLLRGGDNARSLRRLLRPGRLLAREQAYAVRPALCPGPAVKKRVAGARLRLGRTPPCARCARLAPRLARGAETPRR